MNTTMILMFAIPIIATFVMFYMLREELASSYGAVKSLLALPAFALPGVILVAIVFYASAGVATHDTEVWSGVATGKTRVHGTYEQSYQCHPHTVGSGKDAHTEYDTCYETHYTVKWACQSSIGEFGIDSKDSTWRSVYESPDPGRYVSIQPGDPVSKTHGYTNYIQAVPETLFKPTDAALKARFKNMVPAYPDKIYDIYRIDRFLQVGFAFQDASAWNTDISNMLRQLGSQKQVNAIVLIAKTSDPAYMYAVRDAWVGSKKNDVVLVIGSTDGVKMDWVDVISWTKNEDFKSDLKDQVQALGTIDRTKIMPILQNTIATKFERRHMKEFSYLSNEIEPPTWLLVLLCVGLIAGYGGVTWRLTRDAGSTYGGRSLRSRGYR